MRPLGENPSMRKEHIGNDVGKMREALALYFRSMYDCPPGWDTDEAKLAEGTEWFSKLMESPDSYAVLETAITDDGKRKIIGAINAHNAIYEIHPDDQPSKIPVSALARMGAQKDEVYYIDTIATDKEAQRTGIASKMLGDVEEFARKKGFKWIFLRTDDDGGDAQHPNNSVCKFYRKRYTELGRFPDGKESKTHFAKRLQSEVSDCIQETNAAVKEAVNL